ARPGRWLRRCCDSCRARGGSRRAARMTFRPGVRVGVDVGRARVGVAVSDYHGMLATPVRTVARGDEAVAEVAAIANEADAVELVVGHPLSLSGAATASTDDAVEFARALGEATGLPVRLVDER